MERTPTDAARVFFGAWVGLEDEAGGSVTYRIVGADEFNPARGWISVDSPLARALLKKAEGDEVELHLPSGRKVYWVLKVSYRPPDSG